MTFHESVLSEKDREQFRSLGGAAAASMTTAAEGWQKWNALRTSGIVARLFPYNYERARVHLRKYQTRHDLSYVTVSRYSRRRMRGSSWWGYGHRPLANSSAANLRRRSYYLRIIFLTIDSLTSNGADRWNSRFFLPPKHRQFPDCSRGAVHSRLHYRISQRAMSPLARTRFFVLNKCICGYRIRD